MFLIVAGYSFAHYSRKRLLPDSDPDKATADFGYALGENLRDSFGDFDALDSYDSVTELVLFCSSTFLLCVVCFNLLVGVLSDKMAQVMEDFETNSFKKLCQNVLK